MKKTHEQITWALILLLLLNLTLPGTVLAAVSTPTFEVGAEAGTPGDTEIHIPIYAKNNPGIASAKLLVAYDAQRLTLTKVEFNSAWGGQSMQPQTMGSPVTLNWFNGAANYTVADSVFATLTFDVKANAADGLAAISLSYDPEDVYNIAEANLNFAVVSGGIQIGTSGGDDPGEDPPVTDGPTFAVSSPAATAGERGVTVTISAKNNPGIASAKLLVAYDTQRLTLTKVDFNSAWGGMFQQPQTLSSPVTLNWFNGAANYTVADSVFATLTFDVRANAADGMAGISLSYDPEDVYNIAETNLDFAVVNGGVHVQASAPCSMTWNESARTITVVNAGVQKAMLLVATYNNDGRMTNIHTQSVTFVKGAASISFTTAGVPTSGHCKAFLLSTTSYAPLYASIERGQ